MRRPPSSSPRSAGRSSPVSAALRRQLPLWGPQLVVLAALVIDVTLPQRLIPVGPRWLLPSLEGALLIGLVAASPHPRWRHSPARRALALGLTALVSAANIVSLALLCHYLLKPVHGHVVSNGDALVRAGAALWLTNVLLFGLWFWEVDRGGPIARHTGQEGGYDFLFPQMSEPRWAPEDWQPGLGDYLYVSLTNATAFSPTDTMPLTPLAKGLMGAQAVASLVTIGLVVARAVNILA